MRSDIRQRFRVTVLAAIVSISAPFVASAQTCLGVDACLLSPTRADAGRQITPNGCSVPPEAGALGQFWGQVFVAACNQHDIDWGTFKPDIAAWFAQSNLAFRDRLLATCQTRTDLPGSSCMEAANIFFFAVSATSIATDIYRRSQYFVEFMRVQPATRAADESDGPGLFRHRRWSGHVAMDAEQRCDVLSGGSPAARARTH